MEHRAGKNAAAAAEHRRRSPPPPTPSGWNAVAFAGVLGVADQPLWLAIGVQPHVKGFDRIIAALAAHPTAQLTIAGLGDAERNGRVVRRWARRLGCDGRLTLLGFREDIPELMAAADVLVHPARYETTGTVLLEAIINGLPVITTAACGYAQHVDAAQAGIVISEPFDGDRFHRALLEAGSEEQRAKWNAGGLRYGAKPELYVGRDVAMQAILEATSRPAEKLSPSN